jgi:hypothetical protein
MFAEKAHASARACMQHTTLGHTLRVWAVADLLLLLVGCGGYGIVAPSAPINALENLLTIILQLQQYASANSLQYPTSQDSAPAPS